MPEAANDLRLGLCRVRERRTRPVGDRRERRSQVRFGVTGELVAAGHQHQLWIAGCTVVVDAELARSEAVTAQGHTLVVPEGRRGGDPSGDQALHGGEAERDLVHPARIAAIARDDRMKDRLVGGCAGHADRPPGERARARDGRRSDHRRERTLDERADADEVLALLAREPEIVDVGDREIRAPDREELERVARGRRLAHRKAHAVQHGRGPWLPPRRCRRARRSG